MFLRRKSFVVLLSCLLMISACTTKVVVNEPKEEVPNKPVVDEKLSPCKKFSDHKNEESLTDDYLVYRDFLKLKDYDQSFPLWENVYKNAPAADGKRWTVYGDGIRFYQYFLSQGPDAATREKYIDRVLTLYDEIASCYPEQKSYVTGRKAFDLYYHYKDRADPDEVFNMFKSVVDEKGTETPVFVINPFTKLMADRFVEEELTMTEAQKYAKLIPQIVNTNWEKGKDLKSWRIVKDYSIPYLERLESIKGFYDCAYFIEKYYAEYEDNPNDCDNCINVYSRLKYGGCSPDQPELMAINQSLKQNECLKPASPQAGTFAAEANAARTCLKDGDYKCAVERYTKAAELATDPEKAASYQLVVAKIYYSHLKNYSKSREAARKAAKLKANWGDPYILIGKLYASSGPLCGPGTGFDSQVVTWPAIDKWNHAKRIDPSVASEAQKLINRYEKYMPTKTDIWQRTEINVGDTYKVKCWIQENTKVRVAP